MMKNSLKKKTNKKGFTLVELIMVVALIAILAAIAVPTVSNVIDTANANVDASNAQTVELAIKTAHSELVAGTWNGTLGTTTGITANSLTVLQAIQHQGISALPEARVPNATWTYSNGRVFLDTHAANTGRNNIVVTGNNQTTATAVITVS